MSEREICGACRGKWPCACSPQAVSVVLMESVDDELSANLADRMGGGRNDPLTLRPYDPDPPIANKTPMYGNGYCGHYDSRFDLDTDKRVVSCRKCGTALDPYGVLLHLSRMLRRESERLHAAQELEKREAARESERKARAAVRRHRYAPTATRRRGEYCAACDGAEGDPVHTGEPR